MLGPFGDGFGARGARSTASCSTSRSPPTSGCWRRRGGCAPASSGSAVGGLVVLFALAGPLLSLDVFSYITYARLGAEHGLNPYDSAPADIPLDPAGSRVDDWRFAVSVYGPAFTLATYPLGLVGVSAALWILKGVSALAVLAICGLLARVAAVRGVRPATAVAFVGLNPLVLVHVVGGAHNDALMTLGVVAGIAAALAGREALAGRRSSPRRRSRSPGRCRRRSPTSARRGARGCSRAGSPRPS